MYAKPCSKGRGARYGKLWLTTVVSTVDLHGDDSVSFSKKNRQPLEQLIT